MNIELKYFGMISEITLKNNETIHIEGTTDIEELRGKLINMYAPLNNVQFKVAVNETLENKNIELKDNDTLALLPPFAGG